MNSKQYTTPLSHQIKDQETIIDLEHTLWGATRDHSYYFTWLSSGGPILEDLIGSINLQPSSVARITSATLSKHEF